MTLAEPIHVRAWTEMQNLLPKLAPQEKERLRKSIEKYGIRQPFLILPDGRIIDGHHRWMIATELGVTWPEPIVIELDDRDAFELGEMLNLDRRHLSSERIAEIRKRQLEKAFAYKKEGRTQEEISCLTGLPQQTISDFLKQKKNISITEIGKANNPFDNRVKVPKKRHSEIHEKLESGATQEEVASEYGLSQGRVAQIDKKVKKEHANIVKAREKLKVKARIKNERAIDLLNSLADKSVDLLLTDPPYSTEIEDMELFIKSWLFNALDKLKDTGVAYIFVGAYAWELREYLNALKTVEARFGEPQILVWTYKNTIGPNAKTHYSQNWQAILYIRGPEADKIQEEQLTNKFAVQEFNAPDARTGIRFDEFEKPIDIAKRFIQHSTRSDSFVIDPFAGTGTFLLASAELGRKNLGSEVMADRVEIAKTRGCVQIG